MRNLVAQCNQKTDKKRNTVNLFIPLSASPLYILDLNLTILVPADALWPLLLTLFNFNPSMDK